MADFDVQTAILNLREEMLHGFDRVIDKVDGHVKEDAEEFSSLKVRMASSETKLNIIWGLLAALGTSLIGGLAGMVKWN